MRFSEKKSLHFTSHAVLSTCRSQRKEKTCYYNELTVGHIDNDFTTSYQLRLYKESKRIFDIISCAKPIDQFPCQVPFLVVTEIL